MAVVVLNSMVVAIVAVVVDMGYNISVVRLTIVVVVGLQVGHVGVIVVIVIAYLMVQEKVIVSVEELKDGSSSISVGNDKIKEPVDVDL